jgi:macrolide phosphotransferase
MDRESIRDLASRHNIHLQGDLDVNEQGLDFRVAIGKDKDGAPWILRIPRRSDVFERAQYEDKVLKLVKKHVSFNVPDWRICTPELVAYPMLQGNTGLSFHPETYEVTWYIDREAPTFHESLAKVLVELHKMPIEKVSRAGLRIVTPSEFRGKVLQDIEDVKAGLGISPQLETRWRAWVDNDALWPDFATLTHGDLYPGHTIVDEKSNITGVIDWTEAEVHDPSLDFMGHFTVFGEEGVQKLLDAYAKAGGKLWPNAANHIEERAKTAPLRYGKFALLTGQEMHIAGAKVQLFPNG